MIRILSLLLVLTLSAEAHAQGRCEPYREGIRLRTAMLDPEPSYFHSRDRQQMRGFFAANRRALSALQRHTVGVTFTEVGFSIQASATGLERRMGGFCVYLDEVEADFGYSLHEVHITREYSPDSCEYSVILDHENEHVSINRQMVRLYAPRFQQRLQTILRGMQPEFAPSVRIGLDRALEKVRRQIYPFLDEFAQRASYENSSIDTPASYAALQNACEFWGLNLRSGLR